jgi:predicted nucleic acid-binding OB-fold protein
MARRRRVIGFYTDKKKRVRPITARRIRVKVRPAVYRRKGKLIRRKGYTYMRKDVGAPGRGKKVIPELEEDKMNKVAREMGYEKATAVPYTELDKFVEKLVDKYGEREAFGMIHAQVVLRKRAEDGAKKKFEAMREEWRKKYAGGGWSS